jgi:hypothetical protein
MKKMLATAGALALAASVAPAEAGGRYYRPYYGSTWNPGAAAAVGVIGGMALGAAIANARPVYGPPPARVYVEEEPVERCFVERHRVWVPGWGWEMRRRTVCE